MSHLVGKQRATKPEEKNLRKRAILDAAESLLEHSHLDEIKLDQVAKEAGVAKGTLYLYFSSREELFLGLLAREWERWIARLFQRIQGSIDPYIAENFCREFTDSLIDRPLFLRLVVLSQPVLERNTSEEALVEYKYALGELVGQGVQLLQSLFPGSSLESYRRFFIRAYALLLGYLQMHPANPAHRKVLEKPELSYMWVDFTTEYAKTLEVFVKDMEIKR